MTTGLYLISRNPMYLGLVCFLMAFSIYLGTLSAIIIVPTFIWFLTEFQIKPEEDNLKKVFGIAYLDYMKRVRRWV